MDFEWKQLDDNTYELYGDETCLIATLTWNEYYEVWELSSECIECSNDLDEDIIREDVKRAKLESVEKLIEYSKKILIGIKDK